MPWIYRMAVKIMLLALPLYIYVGFRLSSAIANASKSSRFPISKKTAGIIVFIVILWFYLLPITLEIYYLTGNFKDLFVYRPQLQWQDYLVLFPSWWGLISVVEIFPYFVALDIFDKVSRLKIFSPGKKQSDKKQPEPRWLSYLKIGIALFFLFYVGVRTYLDTTHVRISTAEVAIENLPKELQGLRLCLFGDMHVNRYTQGKKLDKLRNTLQAGNEDLIFFTGDLIGKGPDYINQALNVICNPQGKLASTACMGDHDYWTAPHLIAREMKRCGWKFLQNQHHLISYKGHRILVTGITYVYSQRILIYELERLLGNAPKADLKILMVHQPREFLVETAAKYGYHLFLGGHTHGGEVVNHLFGIPFSPGLQETRYCWGQHRFNGLQVVITNGIGRTLAALRYHAPSEITKLVLVKK
ncbi:MAG: metallophosphoesterase [Candidatus Aminicenantes bacterium]|nr:MAG: metallophosphoesterase [Candidatus Aminicenantes bacterium]